MMIDLDIFPLDYLPSDEKKQRRLFRRMWILYKLLYLCGSPFPYIPLTGIKGKAAKGICFIVHYILKFLCITPRFLYKKALKICTKYNHDEHSDLLATFEASSFEKCYLRIDEFFPLKKVKFETIQANIINRYDDVLTRHYGEYMSMPPV